MISYLWIVVGELFVFIALNLATTFVHKKELAFHIRNNICNFCCVCLNVLIRLQCILNCTKRTERHRISISSIMGNYLWDHSLRLNSATQYYSNLFKHVIIVILRLHTWACVPIKLMFLCVWSCLIWMPPDYMMKPKWMALLAVITAED